MALIDELEFCHCDLNRNLNDLVRAAESAQDVTIFGCGDVLPKRKDDSERYTKALEAWLGSPSAESDIANRFQTVSRLLVGTDHRIL